MDVAQVLESGRGGAQGCPRMTMGKALGGAGRRVEERRESQREEVDEWQGLVLTACTMTGVINPIDRFRGLKPHD